MLRTTLAEIKAHPTRLVGVLLAVALSVGFVVACLVFVDTEAAAMKRAVAIRTAGSSVVVSPSSDRDLTRAIGATPGVDVVETSRNSYVDYSAGQHRGLLEVTALPQDPRLRWMNLQQGSWPQLADEVALGRRTAHRSGVGIGDTIRVQTEPGSNQAEPGSNQTGTGGTQAGTRDLRVVGLLDESASLFSDLQSIGVVAPTSTLLDAGSVEYLVIADAGVDPGTLATTLQQRLPADTQVTTSTELADQQLDGLTGGIDVIRYLLLGFGSIAAIVGSMIITNVFGIVVAQRRRQIGLLRAVGATRRQIRRSLLVEATLTGVAGSAAGLLLGLAIAAVAAVLSGSLTFGSLSVGLVLRPLPLALAALAGVVITLISAIAPARRAVVVSPLDALRPVLDPTSAQRTSRVRAAVGGGLALLGAGVITAALLRDGSGTLVLAVGGSALLAAGIIGLAPVFLPPVFRAVARLLRGTRPSVRLAAANTVRNPARAAAVCTALMLGVGLIVTLQVGAASVKASTEASVRHEFPVDVIVRASSGALPTEVLGQVRGVAGIRSAMAVPAVSAGVVGQPDTTVRLDALGADAGSVVSAGLDTLDDGAALAHPFTLEMLSKRDGDSIEVRVGHRTEKLVLRSSDVADAGALVLTTRTLDRLAPDAPVNAVWAATQPGADAAAVMSDIRTVADRYPGLQVGGTLEEVAGIESVLDALLQIATALTAVAVVIALIGMGNSLSLSVIERGRESALLRALGLQRRQLRWMLAAEAVLLAVLGAAVGVLAGVVFGMVGTAAMAAEGGFAETRFAISVGQTGTVIGVAVVAGALASVLPGRRAARARPVEALAEA